MEHKIIEHICTSLKGTTQDIKFGTEYCFRVGNKLFCVKTLDTPHQVSFRASRGEIGKLTARNGIVKDQQYNWVKVKDLNALSEREWEYYLRQSYEIISGN